MPRFARGVGDEPTLRLEACLEPGERRVDGGARFLDLIVGAGEDGRAAHGGLRHLR